MLEVSLCISFLSNTLPTNSFFFFYVMWVYLQILATIGFLKFLSLSPQLSKATGLCLISFFYTVTLNMHLRNRLANYRPYFVWFPFLKDHSPAVPIVQYLKTIVSYIFVWFSSCYGGRAIPISVNISRTEVEILASYIFF